MVLVFFVGTELFPDQDEGQFTINVKLPVGTRSEVTDKFVRSIEDILRTNIPEMQAMISDIGVPSARSGNFFVKRGNTQVAQSAEAFTIYQAPTLTGFSPDKGPAGTQVELRAR